MALSPDNMGRLPSTTSCGGTAARASGFGSPLSSTVRCPALGEGMSLHLTFVVLKGYAVHCSDTRTSFFVFQHRKPIHRLRLFR